jgi:CRP-like cAMP-binding protein
VNCGCTLSTSGRVVELPKRLRPRFLYGLPNPELNSILSTAKHCKFTRPAVMIHQGDPAERFFLLTHGRGRHFVMTPEGKKIVLQWLTAGQIFGGAALLSRSIPYIASTELLSDSCALLWDRQTIREFVCRCPELLDNALSISVTEHLAWMVSSQVSLTSDDARGRIAHLLLSLACGIGVVQNDGIGLEIKNEDLAAGANVTPFTASRVLNEYQRAGALSKRRGKVVLQKPELLLVSQD